MVSINSIQRRYKPSNRSGEHFNSILHGQGIRSIYYLVSIAVGDDIILADEEDDVDDLAVILELLEPSFSEEAISLVDTDSFEDALSVVLFSAHLFEGNGLSLQVSSLSIRWICLFFLSHKTNDCPSAVMRDLTME